MFNSVNEDLKEDLKNLFHQNSENLCCQICKMKANKRVLSDRNNVTRNSHKPYPSKPFPGNDLLRNLDTIHFVSIDNMKFCSLEI